MLHYDIDRGGLKLQERSANMTLTDTIGTNLVRQGDRKARRVGSHVGPSEELTLRACIPDRTQDGVNDRCGLSSDEEEKRREEDGEGTHRDVGGRLGGRRERGEDKGRWGERQR